MITKGKKFNIYYPDEEREIEHSLLGARAEKWKLYSGEVTVGRNLPDDVSQSYSESEDEEESIDEKSESYEMVDDPSPKKVEEAKKILEVGVLTGSVSLMNNGPFPI